MTAVSISMSGRLLKDVDTRAAALGLNRSQYLSVLARHDLQTRHNLVLSEQTMAPIEEAVRQVGGGITEIESKARPPTQTPAPAHAGAGLSRRKIG